MRDKIQLMKDLTTLMMKIRRVKKKIKVMKMILLKLKTCDGMMKMKLNLLTN
jgi:hypothetical protein